MADPAIKVDEYTDKLGLPLPNPFNNSDADISRVAEAFRLLDSWVASGGAVVRHASVTEFPAAGDDSLLYIALDTGRLFQWLGGAYSAVGSPESSDDVAEGVNNLYFSVARARAAQPPATAGSAGVIRVGAGLAVGADGQLSVVGGPGAGGVPAFNELVVLPTAAGQTVFNPSGGYSVGMIEVFKNGLMLVGNGGDYVANDGVKITLNVGAGVNDKLLLRRWTTSNNFPFSSLTSKPTKLAGYGITDALLSSNFTFTNLGGKPTTLAGYGITNGMPNTGGRFSGVISVPNGQAVGYGGDPGGLMLGGSASASAVMSMHVGGYALNMGLDTDNIFRIGGWSQGSGGYRLHLDTAGNLTAGGNVTAYSDRRLKKDLKIISGALAKVRRLNGYTFTMRMTGERQMGLIAQEVDKVQPEAVGRMLGLMTVAYGNMGGLYVEAIKELADEKDREIKELRAQIEEIKALVAGAGGGN